MKAMPKKERELTIAKERCSELIALFKKHVAQFNESESTVLKCMDDWNSLKKTNKWMPPKRYNTLDEQLKTLQVIYRNSHNSTCIACTQQHAHKHTNTHTHTHKTCTHVYVFVRS